jgi:hypothetical protein
MHKHFIHYLRAHVFPAPASDAAAGERHSPSLKRVSEPGSCASLSRPSSKRSRGGPLRLRPDPPAWTGRDVPGACGPASADPNPGTARDRYMHEAPTSAPAAPLLTYQVGVVPQRRPALLNRAKQPNAGRGWQRGQRRQQEPREQLRLGQLYHVCTKTTSARNMERAQRRYASTSVRGQTDNALQTRCRRQQQQQKKGRRT